MNSKTDSQRRHRILLVDDHPLTRRGIAELVNQQEDLTVCGEAGTAKEALALMSSLEPDLVLADFSLPDKSGLELLKEMKLINAEVRILVVSMHDESLYAERVLRAGARGYLMKNEGGEKLLEAIRHVLAGRIYVSDDISAKILDALSGNKRNENSSIAALTDREFEVFQYLGQGLTTGEIGKQLHLSPKTIETHRLHIREKLELHSGAEMIKYAVRWVASQELI